MFRVSQALWAIFLNSCEDFEELQRAILNGDIRHIDTILVTVQAKIYNLIRRDHEHYQLDDSANWRSGS